jgi:hypothetical protein
LDPFIPEEFIDEVFDADDKLLRKHGNTFFHILLMTVFFYE